MMPTTLPILQRDPDELLRALTRVSHAVSNAVSLDEILHLVSEQSAVLLGAERSLVLLTDESGGLHVRAQHGLDALPAASFTGPLDETLMPELARVLADAAPERVLAVPLVVLGRVTGLVAVGPLPAVMASGPREAILTALADQTAAPLESAQLAEQVREARFLAENAQRAARIGTFDWDVSADRITWSPEVYRLHGLAPGTPATLEAWLMAVHPDDRAATQDAIAALLDAAASGTIVAPDHLVEAEYRVVLPDGAVRWIAARVRIAHGTTVGHARLLGVNFDVTERKKVEAALRESEERFRLTAEALAGFLFDWRPATDRLEWFGGLEKVLGFRRDEVSPSVAWYQSRIHPDDLPRARAAVRAALESDAPGYSSVYRVRHRDGHDIDVAERGHIVRDEAGRPVQVLGGISDISERRRLARERETLLAREREARTAAETATRARDKVLAVVSHELGNRFGAIGICAGALLESDEPWSETARTILLGMQQSAESTNRLIRDLTDVTSIEAGRLALEPRDEPPADILARTVEQFAAAARRCGVALETRWDSDLPVVRADAERLLQALANLVVNALKFTERGGRITLRAERDPEGVRFAVEDTGTGISADDLPHVFDPYWQKSRAGVHGTGLGLAIVRGIVEAHGGRLDVTSTPGTGSRFSFTVPATQRRPSA